MYKLEKVPAQNLRVKTALVSRISVGLTNAFYTAQHQTQVYLPFIVSILSPFK
jgi:hypothetical protein